MPTIHINVEDIKGPLHIRENLDNKHVEQLAMLLADGKKLKPITVVAEETGFRLIDGWHRLEAHKQWDLATIEAEVLKPKTEAEHISIAFQANLGGAKPPTKDDYVHTIRMLIERKQTLPFIMQAVNLGAAETRKLMKLAKAQINRQRVHKALDLIVNTKASIQEAAKESGVDVETLKGIIGGNRKDSRSNYNRYLTDLSTRTRSFSMSNYKMFESMQNDLLDGKLNPSQKDEIFKKVYQNLRNFERNVKSWDEKLDQDIRPSKRKTE